MKCGKIIDSFFTFFLEGSGGEKMEESNSLHDVVRAGDVRRAVYLVHNGVSVDTFDAYGFTPLHLAVIGDLGVLVQLLQCAKRVGPVMDFYRETIADLGIVVNGEGDITDGMLQKLRMNLKTKKGETPLYLAIYYRRSSELVKFIASYGADMMVRSTDLTPYMAASLYGSVEILETLKPFVDGDIIQYDVLLEMFSLGRRTKFLPIQFAALGRSIQNVDYLMKTWGFDIHGADDSLVMPPVWLACYNNDKVMIKHLVDKYGVNITLNKFGTTAFYLCCLNGRVDMVDFFIDELKLPKSHYKYALSVACKGGSLHLVKHLIENRDFDVSCRNPDGMLPVHCAAHKGAVDILDYYMKKYGILYMSSAVGNGEQCPGWTLLDFAILGNHLNAVRFLTDPRTCGGSFFQDRTIMNALSRTTGMTHWWLHFASHTKWTKIDFIVDSRNCDDLKQMLRSDDVGDRIDTLKLYGSSSLLTNALGSSYTVEDVMKMSSLKIPKGLNLSKHLVHGFKDWTEKKMDPNIVNMLMSVMIPWTVETHHLYPDTFRANVRTMLQVIKTHGFSMPLEVFSRIIQYVPRF